MSNRNKYVNKLRCSNVLAMTTKVPLVLYIAFIDIKYIMLILCELLLIIY